MASARDRKRRPVNAASFGAEGYGKAVGWWFSTKQTELSPKYYLSKSSMEPVRHSPLEAVRTVLWRVRARVCVPQDPALIVITASSFHDVFDMLQRLRHTLSTAHTRDSRGPSFQKQEPRLVGVGTLGRQKEGVCKFAFAIVSNSLSII